MTVLASIGRTTLPQEFFDVTSRQLLIQPEPQYAHARLIMSAIQMEIDTVVGGLPIPGRDIPSSGAPYSSFEEQQMMLADPFYTQAIKVDATFMEGQGGLPVGHTLRFNRPRFMNTTYTFASREVSSGTVISTTPVNVGSEQVELTIKRYVGPLDPNTSLPAPIGISRFDAARSVHSIPAVREMHFKRDFDKTIDTFGVTLFDSVVSTNVLYPDGMTANNDALNAGDFPFTYALLRKMERQLVTTYIPRFPNGKYMAILTPLQVEQLTRDAEYQRLAVFTPPKNPLLVGSYVGSIGNVDVFQSATLTQTANSNSVTIHYAQMFGPGMVGVAPGEMPRVVPNVQDNYGEDPIAVWLFYCAFGVLDNRFGVSGRSC